METCNRCDIPENRARLYDVIYEGKMGLLCERCAIIENIPVLKKPDSGQLKASEKNLEVYDRMRRLSGYKDERSEEKSLREKRLKELEKNPRLELPIKAQLNLIDHYHWFIMKNRRRKGLSHKQLAEAIGESEIALEMLEKGKIPENSENIIKKLEQFFQISLRKVSEAEAMIERKQRLTRTKPVLLDEDGNELDHIPEPIIEQEYAPEIFLETREIKEISEEKTKEIPWYKKILGRRKKTEEINEETDKDGPEEKIMNEIPIEEKSDYPGSRYLAYRRKEIQLKNDRDLRNQEKTKEEIKRPAFELKENEDLDLDKVDLKDIKISELKEIHKKRVVEATKQEKKEEQKKIEDKQRLIEARKEELRLMKEKESKNIDDVLGGTELLGKKGEEDEFASSVKDFL